jgi:hypothetical protein
MWIRPRRSSAIGGGYCHGARRIKARTWIMVAARICARAYLFGRLSLLVICVGELPVAVRVDVARGTRGIVVWVNVARVFCPFFD